MAVESRTQALALAPGEVFLPAAAPEVALGPDESLVPRSSCAQLRLMVAVLPMYATPYTARVLEEVGLLSPSGALGCLAVESRTGVTGMSERLT